MNKDNRLVKFTAFVLLITIIAICLVSGTFAKYTSEATASATATVAKWSIEVNDTEIAVTGDHDTIEFDLFETINDTVDGNAETDVKATLISSKSGFNELLIVDTLRIIGLFSLSVIYAFNNIFLFSS